VAANVVLLRQGRGSSSVPKISQQSAGFEGPFELGKKKRWKRKEGRGKEKKEQEKREKNTPSPK